MMLHAWFSSTSEKPEADSQSRAHRVVGTYALRICDLPAHPCLFVFVVARAAMYVRRALLIRGHVCVGFLSGGPHAVHYPRSGCHLRSMR